MSLPRPDKHEMLGLYIDEGVSVSEIARRYGLSRQRVHKILSDEIQKLGILGSDDPISQLLDES